MLVDESVRVSPDDHEPASDLRPPLPWERQHAETSRQFASFQIYRDTRPTIRSLGRVAEELGCSSTYVERLSRLHSWVQRATDWDEERDRLRQARLLAHLEDIEKRHLQIADTALTKISQRLEDLDPKDIQVQHIPKLLEAIVRVQEIVFPETPQTPRVGGIIGRPVCAAWVGATWLV